MKFVVTNFQTSWNFHLGENNDKGFRDDTFDMSSLFWCDCKEEHFFFVHAFAEISQKSFLEKQTNYKVYGTEYCILLYRISVLYIFSDTFVLFFIHFEKNADLNFRAKSIYLP